MSETRIVMSKKRAIYPFCLYCPEPLEGFPFALSSVGVFIQADQRIFRIVASKSYRLQYVLSGRSKCVINGRVYNFRKGDVYFEHKGDKVESELVGPEKWSVMHFAFDGMLAEALVAAYNLGNTRHVHGPDLLGHFDALLRLAKNGRKSCVQDGAVIAHVLLAGMAARVHSVGIRERPPLVQKVKTYLDSNLAAVVTMEALGRFAGKSPSQISRVFRKEMGCPPHQYLLNQKMRMARHLLQFTGMSVKEIAFRLNFGDPYVFSKSFKKHAGISPREFRLGGVAE